MRNTSFPNASLRNREDAMSEQDSMFELKERLRQQARESLDKIREENKRKQLNANNWKNFTIKACETWNKYKLSNMQSISLGGSASTKLTPRDFKYLKEIYEYSDRDMIVALGIIKDGLEFSRTVEYLQKQKINSFSSIASNSKLIDWAKSQAQLREFDDKKGGGLLDTSLSLDPMDVIYRGEILARILGRTGDKYRIRLNGGDLVTANADELAIVNDIKWYKHADEGFNNSKGYKEYVRRFH